MADNVVNNKKHRPKSIHDDGPWRLPLLNELTLSPDMPDPIYTIAELEEEARVREKVNPGSKIPRLLWMSCRDKPMLDHWGNGTYLHPQHNFTSHHHRHHTHRYHQHRGHSNDHNDTNNHFNSSSGHRYQLLNHLHHLFSREIFSPKAATISSAASPSTNKSNHDDDRSNRLYFANIDGPDGGRHPLGWRLKYFDNHDQLSFMRKYYANTSILWAFEQISPYAGPSSTDIWRLAVLYIWGGVYLDDDAMISTPFDDVSSSISFFLRCP